MAKQEHRKAVIGSSDNFWLYSSVNGFDLTHPPTPDAGTIYPYVRLETTTENVSIDPAKSALVIIDMQNFFLSPSLGRPNDSKGIQASEALLKYAIPGCRKAGIRIIWLNWGLTQHDIDAMPPSALRAFGFMTVPCDVPFEESHRTDGTADGQQINTSNNKPAGKAGFKRGPSLDGGLGSEIGTIALESGEEVDAGRFLMRDQWNTALYRPLEEARQESMDGKCKREDVWIHKNRMSGLWGAESPCTEYLKAQGIRTLLFAGVNTDQCVGGSLQDAFTKGYDCLLLNDGAATTSPGFAQECVEFNTGKVFGFSLSCKDLANGCTNIQEH